jgi:hypothetical protein
LRDLLITNLFSTENLSSVSTANAQISLGHFLLRLGINPNDYRRSVARDGESVRRLSHNPQKDGFSRAA